MRCLPREYLDIELKAVRAHRDEFVQPTLRQLLRKWWRLPKAVYFGELQEAGDYEWDELLDLLMISLRNVEIPVHISDWFDDYHNRESWVKFKKGPVPFQ